MQGDDIATGKSAGVETVESYCLDRQILISMAPFHPATRVQRRPSS